MMEMTQEWITQFNKKCAEFLGWKFSKEYESFDEFYGTWEKQTYGVWYKESDLIKTPEPCRIYYVKVNNLYVKDYNYSLKFHSDWNWIMEVVEVIESLNMEVSIINKECALIDTEKAENEENPFMIKPVSFGEGMSKKEAVIQAIDQFIDWYNKQK